MKQQCQRRSRIIMAGILLTLLALTSVSAVAQDQSSLQPTLCIPGEPQEILTLSPENFEAIEPDEFNYLINLRAVVENALGQPFEVIVRGNDDGEVTSFIEGTEFCAEFIGFEEVGADPEAALDVLNQLQVGGLIYSSLEQAAGLEAGTLLGNNTFRGLRTLLEARGVAPEEVNAVIDAGTEIAIGTLQEIGASLEEQYPGIEVAPLVDERVDQISTTLEAAKTGVSVEEYFGEALAARLGIDPDELYPQIEGMDINAFLSSVSSEAPEAILEDVVASIQERITVSVQAGWMPFELEAELLEDLDTLMSEIAEVEPFDSEPENEIAFDMRLLRDEGQPGIVASTSCYVVNFKKPPVKFGPRNNFVSATVNATLNKVRFKTWELGPRFLRYNNVFLAIASTTHWGGGNPSTSYMSKVFGRTKGAISLFCMSGSYIG